MSLLDSLIASRVNIEDLAEDWLNEYDSDSRGSFLRIISLIFQTCGLTQNVPPSVFEVGWVNFVKGLESSLSPSALSTYPIIDKRRNFGKQISRNVCNFIGMILSKAEDVVIHDGMFINELCELLHVLTKSSLRAFRHTATLIVVKMITHLSNIAKNLSLQYSRIDRQLSNCDNEQPRRGSSEMRESLENLLAISSLKISELEEKIIFLINVVLPKRFRDVFVAIRLVCIEELEVWLLKYPNAFMGHKNLKYLGWALSDPIVMVRQKSIQALKKIYLDKKLAKHAEMDLFTLKFKERIVTMSLDKNISISVIAIQVISAIHRQSPDLITKADFEYIFNLVYSQYIEVANEVARFIDQVITFALKDKCISELRKWSLSILELKNIVIFTKSEEKIPLLVDAMLCQPDVKYLNEWECYTEILLYPKNTAYESLGQQDNLDISLNIEEERIIISLMENSAKQLLLGENPRSILASKKLLAVKSLRNNEENNESSIRFFIRNIPKFMKKYLSNEDIICSLLSLCLTLDVNVGAENQDIHALFSSLLEVSIKHVDPEIHLACAKAMANLCKGRSPLNKFVSSKFLDPYLHEIVSSWDESLKDYSRKCSELEEFSEIVEEEELIFKLEKNSSRLFVASCHFELGKFLDWEELITICRGYHIDNTGRRHPITTVVMRNMLKTALSYILHELPIENVKEDGLLKYLVDDFLLVGKYILESVKDIDYTIRITAYHCISEIMCIICQAPSSISDLWKESIESTANILMENISALICREEGFDELTENEELELIQNYCSLILKGGLPPAASIHLLRNINKQMVLSSWSYVETTLLTLQKWSMEEFSMIVLGCLTSFYDKVLEEEGDDLLTSHNFGELMEVAEKIYKGYGSKMGQDAKAHLKFHLKGISFASCAVPEKEEMLPRIHFIRPLTVFAPIVDPRFRKKLLDYLSKLKQSLKKKLPSAPEEFVDNLTHFLEYEKILSSSEWVIKPKKHAKKRREKAAVIPGISSGDEEEMDVD